MFVIMVGRKSMYPVDTRGQAKREVADLKDRHVCNVSAVDVLTGKVIAS